MIHHLVVFRLNPDVSHDDPRVAAAVAAMAVLPNAVPSIRRWEHGLNISPRPNAYDFGLASTFDDAAGLAEYATHPAHQAVIALWTAISSWVVCDWEADGA